MDWEAQDEGVIAKIIAPDGTKDIPVGTVVAVVVDDAEHVSTVLPFMLLMTPGPNHHRPHQTLSLGYVVNVLQCWCLSIFCEVCSPCTISAATAWSCRTAI